MSQAQSGCNIFSNNPFIPHSLHLRSISFMSYLQDSCGMLNKARRRWRLAYSVINSVRTLISVSTRRVAKNNTINVPNKRWRVAVTAIYSLRAIASLSREVVAQNNHHLLHSPSFVAIHIDPDLFFSDVDTTSCITKLVKHKDLDTLHQLGGIDGIVMSLQTDERKGVNGNHQDISRRQKAFGCNRYHKPTTKNFYHFVLIAVKDPIIITLLLCATLSLGFSITRGGLKHGWCDGMSILIAVVVVVTVCSMSHFWPYRQFNKLSQMGKESHIEVVRNGQQREVLVSNIVVGDVVCLRSGNQVPADGLVLSAHSSLQMDESSLGEEKLVQVNQAQNPFLLSGAKVESGHGHMLVTSVGENTKWGEIMNLLGSESHKWRSLENRLINLTTFMSIVGLSVAVFTLINLLVRFFSGHIKSRDGSMIFVVGKTRLSDALASEVGILVSTVAVASSAIPEGLPLAVAITVAYTMKRMIKNGALFRQFSTCVQLASASTICINTTDKVTVVDKMKFKFWLDEEFIEAGSWSQLIAEHVRHLLCQGIGLNTSQIPHEFSEEAIVCWATTELSMDVQELREGFEILHAETLSGKKKLSKIAIRKEGDHITHVHLKGKAEEILLKCSHYYGVEGIVKVINDNTRRKVQHTVQVMAQEGFKCIAFAHKVLEVENQNTGEFHQQLEDDSLILLALIGLKDTVQQPGVTKAVEDCKQAGVSIKLITSVDVLTATAVASECGILHCDKDFNNGEVMEALEFRNCTATERIEKADKICVMANAISSDKLLLVQCLKQKGVVAVTGNSIADTPSLKEADVAIYMGFQGNNIAVENSDIVVLKEGFVSVFAVLKVWRGIYDNIKVFIKYLLAANLASLVTDFVSTISADKPPTIDILAGVSVKEIPYAVLQILWLKLIIGTLAVLALVVEQNSEFMLEPPSRPDQPLISNKVCKNILIHASYEIAVLLTFQFKGEKILGLDGNVKDALVFNLMVLFQVFAILKARKPEGNIFRRQRRKLFWVVICGIVILQVVMVKILAKVTGAGDLNWWQWCASIGIAFTCWPIEYVGNKYIPVPYMPFMI